MPRYFRQTAFNRFGIHGQEVLSGLRLTVIGCGALGSVMTEQLVRSGAGHIRIVDADRVSLDNLHRQQLYTEDDAAHGVYKVAAAAAQAVRLNSGVEVEPVPVFIDENNAVELLGEADLVLDATDNFAVRTLINRVCSGLRKPWVHTGVVGDCGRSVSFRAQGGPCFHCLYPVEPRPPLLQTLDTAGILAPVVAVAASLAVNSVLRFAAGEYSPGEMVFFTLWPPLFQTVQVEADPDCPVCGTAHSKGGDGEGYG